jgi:hypothetical protein
MIQIRQTKNSLAAKGRILLVHTSGLHAAGMLARVRFCSFRLVWQESSVSAQAIYRQLRMGASVHGCRLMKLAAERGDLIPTLRRFWNSQFPSADH